MKVTIDTIKQWFKTGLIPTQQQYWDWLDSFWHKDEKLPISSINSLQTILNSKANTTDLDDKQDILTPGDGIIISNGEISLESISHNNLSGRDAAEQHPIGSITGLSNALAGKATTAELADGLNGKEDKGTAYSKSESDGKYALKVLMENLYLNRVAPSTVSATLLPTKPAIAVDNYLTLTTTNTAFDFTSANKYILTRTLSNRVTFDNNSALIVSLSLAFSRNATVEFGTRVIINGVQIASNQSSGQVAYVGDANFTTVNNRTFNVIFDQLATATTFEPGSTIVVEIFSKQTATQLLTTRLYCGSSVSGGDRYSYVQYNFTAVEVNTSQIGDKAVTLPKLADAVFDYFAAETTTVVGPSAADGVTVVEELDEDDVATGNYIVTIAMLKDNHIYDLTGVGEISRLVVQGSEVNTVDKVAAIYGSYIETYASIGLAEPIEWYADVIDLGGYIELYIVNNKIR